MHQAIHLSISYIFTVIVLKTENRPPLGVPLRLVAPAYISVVPPRYEGAGWAPFPSPCHPSKAATDLTVDPSRPALPAGEPR